MTYSIQKKLIKSISLLIIFIGMLSTGYTFYTAKHDAMEWQDDYLRQILNLSNKLDSNALQIITSNDDADTNLYIIKLAIDETRVYDANKLLFTLKKPLKEGLQTVVETDNSYRVALAKSNATEILIVAQNTIERNELILNNILRTTIPIIVLIPLIILLIRKYIVFLFTPITQTSEQINTSNYNDFSTISLFNLPQEIHPFINAINRLLMRVSEHILDQQKFIAEAAHELRSPLTALSLQAERLSSFTMQEQAKNQLQTLREGIARNKNLVEQLLTLASVQKNNVDSVEKHSIIQAITVVIADLMPLIQCKKLDVGIVKSAPFDINVNGHELNILLKNLLDNAIKFSPKNGVIDISILHDEHNSRIEILDSGSGIALDEMDKVFSPFYRTFNTAEIGTGLGLSIVKSIADKIDATIAFKNIANVGLKVTVTFAQFE